MASAKKPPFPPSESDEPDDDASASSPPSESDEPAPKKAGSKPNPLMAWMKKKAK
jgi:hypothetical protein